MKKRLGIVAGEGGVGSDGFMALTDVTNRILRKKIQTRGGIVRVRRTIPKVPNSRRRRKRFPQIWIPGVPVI